MSDQKKLILMNKYVSVQYMFSPGYSERETKKSAIG